MTHTFQSTDFIKQVETTIDHHQMLGEGDRVLAAVSGGPDSIALACVLLSLKERYHMRIGIAHVNHQLRKGTAERDQEFVRTFAEKNDLDFYTRTVDIKTFAKENKLSLETAGRNIRYDFFEQIAADQDYTKIATGHHGDDNAEQVLMNLLRGSGSKGLCGIPPIRGNLYIRPLIQVSKQDILQFLDARQQAYVQDESNLDTRFLRNRIRHHLIPLLKTEYNPEIVPALNRLSAILGSEEQLWNIHITQLLDEHTVKKKTDCIELNTQAVLNMAPAIAGRLLRHTIKQIKGNLNRITMHHTSDMIQFAKTAETGKSLDLPGQIRIYKYQSTLAIKKEAAPLREIGRAHKAVKNKG